MNLTSMIAEIYTRVERDKEKILEAFIAETGCKPSEAMQVVQHNLTGYTWWVESLSKEMSLRRTINLFMPYSSKEQQDLAFSILLPQIEGLSTAKLGSDS